MGDQMDETAASEMFAFIVAPYSNVEFAQHAFHSARDLHFDMRAETAIGATVNARQDSGDVKIFRKHVTAIRYGSLIGPGWGWRQGWRSPSSPMPLSAQAS
jgi:hypothetical protein